MQALFIQNSTHSQVQFCNDKLKMLLFFISSLAVDPKYNPSDIKVEVGGLQLHVNKMSHFNAFQCQTR